MAEPVYLPAPYEGMDVSVPAHMLPSTKSPYVRNHLVDGDRVRLRGPLRWQKTLSGAEDTAGVALTSPGMMFPIWTGRYVLARTIRYQGTGSRWWPWEAFETPHPALITTLPPEFGKQVLWDPIANSFSNATAGIVTHAHAHGPHVALYRDRVFSISTGKVSSGNYLQYQGRFHPETVLVDASPTGAAPGTADDEAPRLGQGLASFAQRLWFLGGIPATDGAGDTVVANEITGPTGGSYPRVLKPNTLWFTNVDADPSAGIGSWQTNLVTNKLVVGAESVNDYGMGLTAAAKYMVIHKKRSTWVLTGSGVDSFAIKEISGTAGLVDPRARLTYEDVVYWVSRDGLQAYDGAEVRNLSEAINPILRPSIETYAGSARVAGSFVQLQALSNYYLLLQTGTHDLYDSGTDAVAQSWLYHIPTGRWTVFYTDNYANPGAPVGTVRSGTNYFHLTTQGVHDATFLTDPLLTTGDRRGNDLSPSNTLQSFPAECYFVPLRLAAPFYRSAIERYGIEAIQEFRSGGTVGEFQAQMVRYIRQATGGQEPGAALNITAAASVAGAQINASDTPEYRPFLSPLDVPNEVTDIQIRISRDYTAGVASDPVVWGEIVGAYLEWRQTHKRAV